jgi:alpha-beta hydrolase superfamily lysophospholipase
MLAAMEHVRAGKGVEAPMATCTNTIINANLETTQLSTGVTMEYLLHGPAHAPVLCFVHGLGSNLRQFLPQATYFSRDYRVLLLSLRGHGDTSNPDPATAAAYATPVLAQDVVALLTHLGIEALHVVGNSLGRLVGYELLQCGKPQLLSLTTFGTTAALQSSRLVYWGVVGSVLEQPAAFNEMLHMFLAQLLTANRRTESVAGGVVAPSLSVER